MKNGFTLIELIIVIAIIGVLSAGLLTLIDPLGQIAKSRDVQRKQDLAQIQKPLEEYYNDHGSYPASPLPFGGEWKEGATQYMSVIPQDPLSSQSYVYQTDAGGYRLFAKLERCSDSQVNAVASGEDCKDAAYNFSIVSSNLSVAPFTAPAVGGGSPGGGGTATQPVLCQDGSNDHVYSSTMVGCNGTVSFSQASSLCMPSISHLCLLDEYIARGGKTIQSSVSRRWLADRVQFFSSCESTLCGGSTCSYAFSGDQSGAFTTGPIKIGYTFTCPSATDELAYLDGDSPSQNHDGAMCCSN